MKQTLVIGFEKSKHASVLLVAKQTKDSIKVLNKFEDDTADELYKILVDIDENEEIE